MAKCYTIMCISNETFFALDSWHYQSAMFVFEDFKNWACVGDIKTTNYRRQNSFHDESIKLIIIYEVEEPESEEKKRLEQQ